MLRVCAIIQICLGLTALCWYAGYPFVGSHYAYKSKTLLYEFVMEEIDGNEELLVNYQQLLKGASKSFLEKGKEALHLLIYDLSIYQLSWMLLSVVIPRGILKRKESVSNSKRKSIEKHHLRLLRQ